MNYKVLGSDQKEYGPATPEELRQWLAEGRANARTLVQAEGSADWKPLGSFPELMPLTAAPVAPGAASGKDPAAAVRVPAILLITAGSLSVLNGLVGVFQGLFSLPLFTLPYYLPPVLAQLATLMMSLGLPGAILSIGLNVVVLIGGFSMLKLRRWGLALAACIIVLLCGNNPCCCPIGLVAGVWGLIQLGNAQVRSAFR
jgi:hypothetical protein